jgi:hypothetical protein
MGFFLIREPFAKVILQVVKKSMFFDYSPLSLCSFPPKGAREIVVPQLFPASSGEGCPKDTGSPLERSTSGVN